MSEISRHGTGRLVGHPVSFIAAFLFTIIWGAFGRALSYSAAWQYLADTGVTVLTISMVFLVTRKRTLMADSEPGIVQIAAPGLDKAAA